MFAIVQLLFLVCFAGFDWLWGCGVVCVWVGGRENGKGGRDKNVAEQVGANFWGAFGFCVVLLWKLVG